MIDQQFAKTIKKHNLFLTNERLEIFAVLKSMKYPCTIAELIITLDETVDRSTVYRTIELFEKINIIKRVSNGWKYKVELSDVFSDHHHHMTCRNCDEVYSFHESPEFTKQLQKLESKYGFRSESHSMELRGLCKNCNK